MGMNFATRHMLAGAGGQKSPTGGLKREPPAQSIIALFFIRINPLDLSLSGAVSILVSVIVVTLLILDLCDYRRG